MKITFVDADPILWKGDANMRLIDLAGVIMKIHKNEKQDKIFLIGGFDEKNLFKAYLYDVVKKLHDLPVSAISTYSELEERNVSNISVINLFYQSFLAQNDVAENTYTIIAGDTNLFSMDKYAKKAGGNPIRYILTNDIPQLDTLGQSHKIIDTIDVNPENMSVFDKLTAKEIINLIKNDDKAGKYDTIASILHKCKTFSKMPNHQTLFILHSLIHGGYLKREVKSVDEDKNKTTIVLGDETKLEQLLSKLD